jgi:hypothetical protein
MLHAALNTAVPDVLSPGLVRAAEYQQHRRLQGNSVTAGTH